MGPMTGRAAGYCAGYANPGFMSPIPGRGSWGGGRGFGGRGRGWRNMYYATGMPGWMRASYGDPAWGVYPPAGAPAMPSAPPPVGVWPQPAPEQQLDALKGQAEYLEDMLDGVKQRIGELEAAKADTEA